MSERRQVSITRLPPSRPRDEQFPTIVETSTKHHRGPIYRVLSRLIGERLPYTDLADHLECPLVCR
ncbi:MAG TPA: hypothetical protein VKV19_06720 [Ktedonobacteraceae bacterium]|nr:hypothetical protein [Ktedonobacteraceae bacterium]